MNVRIFESPDRTFRGGAGKQSGDPQHDAGEVDPKAPAKGAAPDPRSPEAKDQEDTDQEWRRAGGGAPPRK
jgi:hypothetical protein